MVFARSFAFSLTFIAAVATIAHAEESWIGRRVMPKAEAKFVGGDKELSVSRAALPLIVSKVDGEKLWVGWGWVERKHVVPADDAVAYYNGILSDRLDNSSWVLPKRAAAWAQLDELDFALEDILMVIRRDPKNAEAYRIRARIWFHRSQATDDGKLRIRGRELAMKYCNRAIQLDPLNSAAYGDRGEIRQLVGGDELADYSAAIRLGQASARTYFNRASARQWQLFHLSDAQAKQKLLDDLIEDLTAAVRRDPNYVEAFAKRATMWKEAAQPDNAVRDFTFAIQLEPKNITLFRQRAEILENTKQWDKAIDDYTQIIRLAEGENAETNAAYLSRGLLWKEKGRLDRAEADFTDAIAARPSDATSYIHRSKVRRSQGQSEKALADLNEAIKLESTEAQFYMARAAVRQEMGQFVFAIKDVENVFALSREHKASYVTRSELWQVQGESKASIEQLDEAIKQSPESAKGYRDRGEYYFAQGDSYQAKEDFGRAIELAKDDAETYNLRGIMYYLDGNRHAAGEDFYSATRLDPKNERYRFNANVVSLAQVQWREPIVNHSPFRAGSGPYSGVAPSTPALLIFDPYIKRDPKDARAYLNRGVYWQSQRVWGKALEDYNQAIRFNPKSAKAHHNRGEVFREMKQLDKALADFNEAIRLDPKLTHAFRRRGQVWQAKGQLEKALGDYKLAIRPVLQQ
jgi:tetratricopeptide (TPR) repeat protein